MIKFLPTKDINLEEVNIILNESRKINHWTNNGPVKLMLEKTLHTLFELDNSKRVICVANGTLALHALMFLYNQKANKKLKWLSPSFTFPSVVVNESNTLLVDIELTNYSLDHNCDLIDECDGIVITNLFGTLADIKYWEKLAKEKNKILIFDNAASALSKNDNKNICTYGNSCIGSLHHTKYLGFGEGGFIVIDNDDATPFEQICNFGFDTERKHKNSSSNFKMSDPNASFILAHVRNFSLVKHLDVQETYLKLLEKYENIKPFNYKKGIVYGNMPIIFKNPIEITEFRNLGIEANKYYRPLNNTHVNSNWLFDRIINLPLHSQMTEYEFKMIDDILNVLDKKYK